MRSRPSVQFLAVLFLVGAFAGCTSGAKPAGSHDGSNVPLKTVAYSSAAAPKPNEEFGAISGVVVDDERLPIPTTTILIQGRPENTTSDGAGKFTINGLPSGTYKLTAGRESFTNDTKSVTVKAGEVVNVTFVLRFVLAAQAPYQLSSERVGEIVVGNDYLVWQILLQNVSGTYDAICHGCMMVYYFDPNPVGAMTEVYWDCSAPCVPPAINDNIWGKVLTNWTTGASGDGQVLVNYYPKNHSQFVWANTTVAKLAQAKGNRDLFELEAGGYGVSYSIKVHVWQSLSYLGPFPDGFTAMPPA